MHLDVVTELDEGEREEFYRLKKVQGKKKRDIARRDAERAERLITGNEVATTKSANLLEQAEDDLLF